MLKHPSVLPLRALAALALAGSQPLLAGPSLSPSDKSPLGAAPGADPGAASFGPRFRAGLGVQWRALNSISLHAVPRYSLSSAGSSVGRPGGSRSAADDAAGPANGAANRVYRDGFVFIDQGTEGTGTTWWWGYDSASQIQDGSVVLHTQADYTEAYSSSRGGAYEESFEDEGGAGPVLELGADWQIRPGLLAGADFTFSFMQADVAGGAGLFTGRRESVSRRTTLSDTYALQGVVPPQAPYEGSLEGPGPLIDNVPSRRDRSERVTERRVQALQSDTRLDLSLDVYNLSFGPSFTWERGRFSLRGTAALELDIVSWELAARETLSAVDSGGQSGRIARHRDSASGTDVLPGVGLSARAAWRFTDTLEAAAFGKWRAMDTLDMEAGNTGARLDPGGWTAGVALGVRF